MTKKTVENLGTIIADPPVLFVKHKAISDVDKAALKAAGIIVIEMDDPTAVKFVRAKSELAGGELLQLAAEAITQSEISFKKFGLAVATALSLKKH
jgi:hypothetical protein